MKGYYFVGKGAKSRKKCENISGICKEYDSFSNSDGEVPAQVNFTLFFQFLISYWYFSAFFSLYFKLISSSLNHRQVAKEIAVSESIFIAPLLPSGVSR